MIGRLVDRNLPQVMRKFLANRLDDGSFPVAERAIGPGDNVGKPRGKRFQFPDSFAKWHDAVERANQAIPT